MNTGQLRLHMRGQFGLESVGLNKIQGKPFHVAEMRSGHREPGQAPSPGGLQLEASA